MWPTRAPSVNAGSNEFKQAQRGRHFWINFGEIAAWQAGSILPDKQKRIAALDLLGRDLLAGDFDQDGHPYVLYLHSSTPKCRMTREWLKDVIDNSYDNETGRSEYLPYCWIGDRCSKIGLRSTASGQRRPAFSGQNPSPSRSSRSGACTVRPLGTRTKLLNGQSESGRRPRWKTLVLP